MSNRWGLFGWSGIIPFSEIIFEDYFPRRFFLSSRGAPETRVLFPGLGKKSQPYPIPGGSSALRVFRDNAEFLILIETGTATIWVRENNPPRRLAGQPRNTRGFFLGRSPNFLSSNILKVFHSCIMCFDWLESGRGHWHHSPDPARISLGAGEWPPRVKW